MTALPRTGVVLQVNEGPIPAGLLDFPIAVLEHQFTDAGGVYRRVVVVLPQATLESDRIAIGDLDGPIASIAVVEATVSERRQDRLESSRGVAIYRLEMRAR